MAHGWVAEVTFLQAQAEVSSACLRGQPSCSSLRPLVGAFR